MSFISYAQNFEDVMLWRALKHIDRGFYIDVGANDPDKESVTKAFYERGWSGINVEPIPQWFERLEKERPRDINLQLALGAEPGEITLYEIPDTGLSTSEKKFAERHEAERGYHIRELRVKVDTLSNVCEKFHLAPIHFLKVDVEGMEMAVFQGTDFGKIRPWIILVESTLPNSQEASYSEWESLLLNGGYEYAYFDGLNRFYVAVEHENLKAAFKTPPNVFDEFVISNRLEAERRAQAAEAKVKEAEERANQAEAQAREAEERAARAEAKVEQAEVKAKQAEVSAQQAQQRAAQAEARAQVAETFARLAEERAAQAEATLQAIFSSRSWRVTEPLRQLASAVRAWLKNGAPSETSNRLAYAPSMTAPRELRKPSPGQAGTQAPLGESLTAPRDLMELSPRAREIYFQLTAAIEKNQENG